MEETETHRESSRHRTTSSTEVSDEMLHTIISRVFLCSFRDALSNYVYLPQTTEMFKHGSPLTISTSNLISQCLMEALHIIGGNCKNPFLNVVPDHSDNISLNSFSASPTHTLSPSPSPVRYTKSQTTAKINENDGGFSRRTQAFDYLLQCYARVTTEELNHPRKSSIPPLSDLLIDLRAQIVQHTSLLLRGVILPEIFESMREISLLLQTLLDQTLPRGFLSELVTRSCEDWDVFVEIFSPLLKELFEMMQKSSIVEDEHRKPLLALNDLVEIRCGTRPICTLLTSQRNFLPVTYTKAVGRELSRTAYLSAFLSTSVFAEDDSKVAEKFFSGNATSDRSLSQTLQQELENSREVLHRIFHNMLANAQSRDATLTYLATVLRTNEKRTQIHSEEKALAGDGFMLNLLTVLQVLSIKVKLDKVDVYYPFYPKSLVDIENETRLIFTSNETIEWLETFSKLCKLSHWMYFVTRLKR